jgi:hypothetical protein
MSNSQIAGLFEFGCDLAEAHALAGLRARPTQSLGEGHDFGPALGQGLPALALATLAPDAVPGAAQLSTRHGLVELGYGAGPGRHRAVVLN